MLYIQNDLHNFLVENNFLDKYVTLFKKDYPYHTDSDIFIYAFFSGFAIDSVYPVQLKEECKRLGKIFVGRYGWRLNYLEWNTIIDKNNYVQIDL